MKARKAALILATTLVLAACATRDYSSPHRAALLTGPLASLWTTRADCNTATCMLDVTVGTNSTTGNCIPATTDVIVIAGSHGQRTITWNITTSGYEFSREDYKFGLFIKSDPGDQFKNVQITDGGRSLSIKFDKKTPHRAHEYALTVRRNSGAKAFCDTLDPWMIE
ncbi:MAG TPA: hypothetical protein VNG69_07775 [Casimicrobiaceae bacterium]|nr:hypothetical protein [Casimicrobiaceae bacterium]